MLAFGFATTRDILLRAVFQGYDYLSTRFIIGRFLFALAIAKIVTKPISELFLFCFEE